MSKEELLKIKADVIAVALLAGVEPIDLYEYY